MNDLHSFDLALGTWIEITISITGVLPSARSDFGFTSTRSRIYAFGGRGSAGVIIVMIHSVLFLVSRLFMCLCNHCSVHQGSQLEFE